MAAAVILDFENLKNLTADTVRRVNMHHRAKFGQNRSKGLQRNRDFSIFQDGVRRHLEFSKIQIFTSW